MTEVLYAYAALRAGSPLPPLEGLEGASLPFAVVHGALAVVASSAPAAFFAEGGPVAQADWVARQAMRHHGVCRALALRALPLAFGAVFSGEGALRRWMAERAGQLEAALDRAEGCAEWTVLLREDGPRLDAFLERADDGLCALRGAAEAAGPGTRFLLERRLAKAREAARARLRERASERLRAQLAPARALMPARARDGSSGLTALLPEPSVAALRARLDEAARDLAETGLELAVTGPWPAYGFAREALGDARGA